MNGNEVGDQYRTCTVCGESVEDEPYTLWLFHKCRECAEELLRKGRRKREEEAGSS